MDAVIFIGMQAAGKTSFYRQCLADSHVHISLDVQGTRQHEEELFAACLKENKSFVVDNTNARGSDRARYITRSRAAGFRVIAYFFPIALKAAIQRNNQRAGKRRIPVVALAATFRKLEVPRLDEGFDSIYSVAAGPDETFVVTAVT